MENKNGKKNGNTRKYVSIVHEGKEHLNKFRQWRNWTFCSILLCCALFCVCFRNVTLQFVVSIQRPVSRDNYDCSGLIDLLHCLAFVYKINGILHVRSCLLSRLVVNTCFLALLSLKYTLTLISEVFFEPMFSFEKEEDRGKNILYFLKYVHRK